MTRPLVVCVFSVVLALVTLGVCATGLTVIVAKTTLPPRPPTTFVVDACTSKLNVLTGLYRLVVGVNFRPASPCATVMKVVFVIAVTPSFWYSVPPVMFVISKYAAAVPSAGLGVSTRPLVVCVFSVVVALVTLGVVAAAVTVIVAGTTAPPMPAAHAG